jgi:NifU-like protein involved in Fe-S cluster formation
VAYSEKVLDRFENPKHAGSLDKDDPDVGIGLAGAPACGDLMKLSIRVDPDTGIITEARWKAFGCGSAIASSEYACELLEGKDLAAASELNNGEIARELDLPPV